MQDDQPKVSLKFSGHFRDRFEIYEKIGSGSTGTAFLARDRTLDRKLAIKVLNADRLSEADVVKLHREARTTCRLKHPNIVEIYDFIMTDDNRPVMVMEYLEGVSLEKYLDEHGPVDLDDAIPLFRQICEAMEYAHGQGILHRDLTPGNVILRSTASGAFDIKILDFGIAKIDRIDDLRISHSGVLIGTVTVISPEQARGHATDARSDVYSMGCLMFKVLTGRFPFEGDTPMEIAYRQINDKAPTLNSVAPEQKFSIEIEQIIARALAKTPDDRFPSMSALEQQLGSILCVGEADGIQKEVASPNFQLFNEIEQQTTGDTAGTSKKGVSPVVGTALVVMLALAALGLFISPTTNQISDQHPLSEDQNKILTLGGLPLRSSEDTIWYLLNDQKWRRVPKLDDTVIAELASPQRAEVKRINMRKASFDSIRLQKLLELNIVSLDLRDTLTDDATLRVIARFPSVRALMLSGCKNVTNEGIKAIAKLPNLTALNIGGTGITDEVIPALVKNKSLRHLNIEDNKLITDAAVAPLVTAQQLESLDISATSISKNGVKLLLAAPSNIALLTLAGLNLTDGLFESITLRPNLVLLDLSNNKLLSDRLFPCLRNSNNLRYLNTDDCPGITESAMASYSKTSYGHRVLFPSSEMVTNSTEWYLEPTWYQLSWSQRDKKIRNWSNIGKTFHE